MILSRLPMTKGVVKCIDTVETFLQENLNMPKESFKIFWLDDVPDQSETEFETKQSQSGGEPQVPQSVDGPHGHWGQ